MRYYEMLFIVHPNYEQDRLDAVISSVQEEITSEGGTLLKIDNWGKRKLAYMINKQRYGSYVLMYFESDPSMIQGLHEWMEIQAQVLHQMIIRLEEKPELSAETQNPDSSFSAPYKKAESRDAKTVKAPVKEEVVVKEAQVEETVVEEETVVKEETPVEVEAPVVEKTAVEEKAVVEEATEEKGV